MSHYGRPEPQSAIRNPQSGVHQLRCARVHIALQLPIPMRLCVAEHLRNPRHELSGVSVAGTVLWLVKHRQLSVGVDQVHAVPKICPHAISPDARLSQYCSPRVSGIGSLA
jgi:hypothetical protein